jgi:hypothetical protein
MGVCRSHVPLSSSSQSARVTFDDLFYVAIIIGIMTLAFLQATA